MSIFLNGLEVRVDELKHDLKVEFRDLNEKGQRRFFMENKKTFLYDAFTSQYPEIRQLPLNFKGEYSLDTLNEIINKLYSKIVSNNCYQYVDLVLELLNIPEFEPDEELQKKLSHSGYYPILFFIAESPCTSFEILKDMFFSECSQFLCYNYSDLLDSIIKNPNFNLDCNFIKELELRYKAEHYHRIIEKIKTLRAS